jgi:hypothetical protein
MLGHLVSNAFQDGAIHPARRTRGLLRRLWAFFFRQ